MRLARNTAVMHGPLPQEEFDAIFSRVPRLTVELVAHATRGVLLQLRQGGPCSGLWSLPGGTVRFGEPLRDAVSRVARDELGLEVIVREHLGFIEYPSHYESGLDSPVGIAFAVEFQAGAADPPHCQWFTELPLSMHDEQRVFLTGLSAPAAEAVPDPAA